MDSLYLSLISAFIGAIIGSFTTIIVTYIQNKQQNKRDLIKLALEIAIEDQKKIIDLMKTQGKGFKINPLSVWVYYNWELIKLIDKNKLTPENISKLDEGTELLTELIKNKSTKIPQI